VDADHRRACVETINAYCEESGLGGIVVCSRTAEYEALGTKLKLGGAVLLQPLKPQQVDEYLAAAGPRLDALRTAMRQDATLQELAKTPLMLSVMTLTYRDIPAEALIPAQPDTTDGSRQLLFAAYVDRMFTRLVRTTRESYARRRTATWLAWLARPI
jgi:hypothetical protein